MDPKQNKHIDEDTIQDVSGDEAEKVAGGGIWRGGGFNEPEPPPGPPTNDGQIFDF